MEYRRIGFRYERKEDLSGEGLDEIGKRGNYLRGNQFVYRRGGAEGLHRAARRRPPARARRGEAQPGRPLEQSLTGIQSTRACRVVCRVLAGSMVCECGLTAVSPRALST